MNRFHAENTYLVVYKENEIVGILAFREQRPFSIDEKVGAVENYLEEGCVKKSYRTGRVLLKLA